MGKCLFFTLYELVALSFSSSMVLMCQQAPLCLAYFNGMDLIESWVLVNCLEFTYFVETCYLIFCSSVNGVAPRV